MSKKLENLSIAVFIEAFGDYDENDHDHDSEVCTIMNWLTLEKLPGLYNPSRQQWIKDTAREWRIFKGLPPHNS